MRPICILIAALLLATACGAGDDEEGEQDIRVSATATALTEVSGYGSVVLFRFTLKNENPFPVFIDHAETLEGYRLTLAIFARPRLGPDGPCWAHSGLLLPGQALSIEAPHRVIVPEERILLTVRPATQDELPHMVSFLVEGRAAAATADLLEEFERTPHPALRPPVSDTGRTVLLARSKSRKKIPETIAVVSMPCPDPPFDPWSRGASGKAWTWSQTLAGFVFRPSGSVMQLFREDGMTLVPPVPFEFLRDLDYFPDGVEVFGRFGQRRVVAAANLNAFLSELRASRGHLEIGDSPEEPGTSTYVVR